MDTEKPADFIENIAKLESLDELRAATITFLKKLGFEYFACVSHVDWEHAPANAVGLHNYPEIWAEHFIRSHLEKIDPVQRYARYTFLPFFWDDPDFLQSLSAEQISILEDAKTFGVGNGYTVPIHAPQQVSASFSVCPGDKEPSAENYTVIQLIAPFVYNRALHISRGFTEPTKDDSRLTARQRQCLELAALGKSDWVIGEILNISERTVHHHLESAKKRLGVATRAQAIVEALRDAQISMADIQPGRYTHNE